MSSTLAERWVAAVNAAIELSSPAEIVAHIRTADAPDDGLRAATYEARIRNGHVGDSHPERLALDPHHTPAIRDAWKRDDEIAVARAGLAFIDAISAINATRDQGTADDWDEAITIANVLAELHDGHHIATAIDLADDHSPYHATIRAVTTLTRLAHRWGCPHIATIQERLAHPDVCLSHARIGIERPVHGRLAVCKTCRDILAKWGDPFNHHRDADTWPTGEMLHALEAGQRVEYWRLEAEYLAQRGMTTQRGRCRVS